MNGILIPVLAGLLILSGFFSSTETAYSSLNKIRLKNKAAEGNRRAALTLRIAEDYDRLLSTILIGNNIVNIASASLSTVLFTAWLGGAGVSVSTVVMTVLVLIFGEITPKSLAKEAPESFAMFAAPIMRFFMGLLRPVNFLFMQWKKLITRIFKIKRNDQITEEELKTMVDEAESGGGIDRGEGDLLRSAIEFHDMTVEEICTPRVDVVAVDEEASMEEIGEIFRTHGLSRLPVYRETVDSVIGVIHEKDYYLNQHEGATDLHAFLNDVTCVAPGMKITALLRLLQQNKSHMAIVVDEFGGTVGVVTLEDILEELVGEIWDEHDEVVEEFRQISDHVYRVSCGADLEDMFELFRLNVDTEDFDFSTISGWVMQELGKIPEAGDQFDYENLHVTVTQTDMRRVLEIEVRVDSRRENKETGD